MKRGERREESDKIREERDKIKEERGEKKCAMFYFLKLSKYPAPNKGKHLIMISNCYQLVSGKKKKKELEPVVTTSSCA